MEPLSTITSNLLAISRKLIDSGDFQIAIVVAHMACEVATERALGRAFLARGIPDLEGPIEAFLSGYNLANDRIRELYDGLTKRTLHNEPFWQAFKESAIRRNQIIHKSKIATESEANESHAAATALVAYLI